MALDGAARQRQLAGRPGSPVPEEVATSVTEAPVLGRFAVLTSFFGAGRKLTQTGQLTLADARELIGPLGLHDRLDEKIGDHVFRTRSAAELPELSFTVRWALRAGALRKYRGKLAATLSWGKAPPVEQFARAGQALVALGPLAARHAGAWLAFVHMFEVIDRTFPSLLARLAEGPLHYDDALGQLFDYLDDTYEWSGPWADPGNLRQALDGDLAGICQLLELAGMATRQPSSGDESAGPVPGAEGVGLLITPTPAGAWLLPRLDLPADAPQVYAPLIAPSATVHELRVCLDGIEPEVWRSVVVPSQLTLASLHLVLQAVMGWQDCHLHEFTSGGVRYGVDDGEGWGEHIEDERRHRLGDVAGPGDQLGYLYDFGDSWEHKIEVRLVRPAAHAEDVPTCTGGERACPPEDVGGWPGYETMLAAIADPRDDEHEDYIEWVGGSFDPEHFDVSEVNRRLRKLRRPPLR